jgi:transcriptional regulator with XRE-family HTH domain
MSLRTRQQTTQTAPLYVSAGRATRAPAGSIIASVVDPSNTARSNELRAFLRARRQRLAPHDVGLPSAPGRRAAGLRRDDVAELAGVSVSWYAQFELGRSTGASPRTVSAIARALRLDEHETDFLFALTRTPVPPADMPLVQTVTPELRGVVEGFDGGAAAVFGRRYDVLVANRAARWLGIAGGGDGFERNFVWRIFTHAPLRKRFVDWEPLARNAAAYLRDGYGRNVGDPAYGDLIAALHRTSGEFTRYWDHYRVAPLVRNAYRIRVDGGEPIVMASTASAVIGVRRQILSFLVPCKASDLPRLRAIVAQSEGVD